MRRLLLTSLSAALMLRAGGITAEDREKLVVHLEMTGSWLADEVKGLSPNQLEYRASPDRWTIREVVSHLAVSEPDYWRGFTTGMKVPLPADWKSHNTDDDILWYGIDRVEHTKTGGGHEKVETYKTLSEALTRFQDLRKTMLEYVRKTDEDLRAHPFGKKESISCWQWMLEISTHSQRHILQIREIKADPNFPKS